MFFTNCLRLMLPLAAVAVLLGAGEARAQTTTLLTVNQYVAQNGGVLTVNANDLFLIDLEANHSYSCEAVPSDVASDFDFSLSVVGTTGTSPETVTGRATGDMRPMITGEADDSGDNRLSLLPTTANRFQLTVEGAKLGGEIVRVRCVDTTLYGGYNTNVNDFNFLEISNVSTDAVTGSITATNFDGTVVISAQAFTVQPGRRVDVDIHSAAGADKFGVVTVTHNGPPGALQANVSQYAGAVTDFELRSSNPLQPLANLP